VSVTVVGTRRHVARRGPHPTVIRRDALLPPAATASVSDPRKRAIASHAATARKKRFAPAATQTPQMPNRRRSL
jgi:hypothetical protein